MNDLWAVLTNGDFWDVALGVLVGMSLASNLSLRGRIRKLEERKLE